MNKLDRMMTDQELNRAIQKLVIEYVCGDCDDNDDVDMVRAKRVSDILGTNFYRASFRWLQMVTNNPLHIEEGIDEIAENMSDVFKRYCRNEIAKEFERRNK